MDRTALEFEHQEVAGRGLATVAGSPGRPHRTLFGREDLTRVYRRARDLIVKHEVFRMRQITTDSEGSSSLVICNLWRVDRSKDGKTRTFEFDMKTEQWVEDGKLEYWPEIPLFPIRLAQSLDWWREVVRRVVWKALMAAGYGDLPRRSKVEWGRDEKSGNPKVLSGKPEMSRHSMAYVLIEHYLGKVAGNMKSKKKAGSTGFLKPPVMAAGARALRASIFDHVLDSKLVSVILAIDYRLVSLHDYLRYAAHGDALLRVAREHRNLLPLLPEISHDQWDREDLFSRKLWVKDGRARTVVDYARFSRQPRAGFRSFHSRAAWRWLNKAQLTVVRRWASGAGGLKGVAVLENLGKANITVKIPAIAWRHIVDASYGMRLSRIGVNEAVQRLYRVFATHCAAMWKEKGFDALKGWLNDGESDLGDMCDWLAAEGFVQGFPDKFSTWDSLRRRCEDWHQRVAIENMQRRFCEDQTWESLVEEVTIDGVIFTPLNSVKDLAREGYEQHHCVVDYTYECVKGGYRVYSAVEPDGKRSTLGIWLDQSGRWSVEQHRVKFNLAVSEAASQAGQELARRYHQAHIIKVRAGKSRKKPPVKSLR